LKTSKVVTKQARPTASTEAKVTKPTTKTKAELAAEKARQKIQGERLKDLAKKSHKDRVTEFNDYLSKLSEHHDIPKVFVLCCACPPYMALLGWSWINF
jgi:protein FAM32A